MKIIELSKRPDLLDNAIQYFWSCWGKESNFDFYRDCIENALNPKNDLPKFFIVLENEKIIASYALLVNDIISRQDLKPWFACLFVNETHRNQGIAGKLLIHAIIQTKQKGYKYLYLNSDLDNFYERKGWIIFSKGYNVFGEVIPIFQKAIL